LLPLIHYPTGDIFSYFQLDKAGDALPINQYSDAKRIMECLLALLELVVLWTSLILACSLEHGFAKSY
jgi:hypothetical protein